LTGAGGTWSGDFSPATYIQVNATSALPWSLALTTETVALGIGTYQSTDTRPGIHAQLEINGVGCDAVPTGPFAIERLEAVGDTLTRLIVSFNLQCEDAGTVAGCVTYAR
jgi:hypothetical protein